MVNELERRSSFDNPNIPINQALAELVSAENSSGQAVTTQSVLGCPAVFNGVKLIAGKVASLPVHIYKRSQGLNLIDDNHPGNWVLQRPNKNYGKFTLFSALVHNMLLTGNGYALITRDPNYNPIALSLLDSKVTYPLLVNGDLAYKTEINGQKTILQPEAILHIKNLTNDGYMGISVIDVLRESLGLSQSLIKYGATFFRNYSMLGHVIELPGYLDDEAVAQFRSGWGDFHKGLGKKESRGLGLLQGGATLKPLTVNNEDAEFLASREFDITMIANILCIPQHKLGSSNRSQSYSSLESENQSWLDDGINPILATFSEEIEHKLLTEFQKNNAFSHFVDFDRSFFVRADLETQQKMNLDELQAGAITLDQYNLRLNRPPVGGDVGSLHRMPSNYVYCENVLAAAKAAEAAAKQAATQPVPDTDSELEQEQQPSTTGESDIPDDYQAGDAPLTDDDDLQRKLKVLTDATMNRLLMRLQRAYKAAIEKREDIDIAGHVSVFVASGLGYTEDTATQFIKEWIKNAN